jgi:hypothetical protein
MILRDDEKISSGVGSSGPERVIRDVKDIGTSVCPIDLPDSRLIGQTLNP